MSAKEKTKSRVFRKCKECSCTILTEDEAKHQNVCNAMFGEESFFGVECAKHSFIKNSRFFFLCTSKTKISKAVSCNETKKFIVDNKELDGDEEDYIVKLPLIIMELCSIAMGNLVLLSNMHGDQIIRTADYANEYLKSDISLHEKTFDLLNLKAGDFLIVEDYTGSVNYAEEMTLITRNEVLSAPPVSILDKLKKHESFRYLSIGNRICLSYMGNSYEFSVKNIVEKKGISLKNNNEEEDSMCSLEFDPKLNNFETANLFTSTPVIKPFPHTKTTKNKNRVFYYITNDTKITIESENCLSAQTQLSYDTLGGLNEEISLIKKLVDQSIKQKTTIGILLSGPLGVGKSTLVQTVAAENKTHTFITVNKPTEMFKTYSDVEQIFEEARIKSPSILFIENIDEWCPKRSDQLSLEHIYLRNEINEIHSCESAIIVFATTKDLNDLDQTLRRPQYLDFEIELNIPNVQQKTEIFQKIALQFENSLTDLDIFELSKMSHGFTASNIKLLIEKAFLQKSQHGKDIKLEFDDLKCEMKNIVPNVIEGFNYEFTKVYWTDIGGYQNAKEKLIQTVEWPLKHAHHFTRLGITPFKGILLYGPSGCGKSLLVEAAATESGFNFIYVTSNDISIKFVGKSEEAIKKLFQAAKRAAPCIIFFDKIECMASVRGGLGTGGRVESRVLGQLLTAIEEVKSDMVIIIGATTKPQLVDRALLRPGRLGRKIHVPVPDSDTRREIFKICLKKLKVTDEIVDDDLIQKTENFSGADIKGLCHSAMRKALQEQKQPDVPNVKRKHFHVALETCVSSTSNDEIEMCANFQ